MMTMTKPQQPYILLSSVKASSESLCLVKIKEEGERIRIGRSHQCEIRIEDISVSRTHAEIKFASDNFYLNDLKSKFGTLVRFEPEYKHTLNKVSPVKFQIGRTVYEFKIIEEAHSESELESDIE